MNWSDELGDDDAAGRVQELITARSGADDPALLAELLDVVTEANGGKVMDGLMLWMGDAIARADPVLANRDSMARFLADVSKGTLEAAGPEFGMTPDRYFSGLRAGQIRPTEAGQVAADLIAARLAGADDEEALARGLGVGMTDVMEALVAWMRMIHTTLAVRVEERGLIEYLLDCIDDSLGSLAAYTKRSKASIVQGMWLASAGGDPFGGELDD